MRRAAETLLPLAAAVIVTCALLSLGGRQLNIFHLVGLLLVVGVGSNYTLFFERETFGRTDPQRTLVSLALCNASTVIGFGLLSLARAPVLSAIGTTVALGAFLRCCLPRFLPEGPELRAPSYPRPRSASRSGPTILACPSPGKPGQPKQELCEQARMHPRQQQIVAHVVEVRHAAFLGAEIAHRRG